MTWPTHAVRTGIAPGTRQTLRRTMLRLDLDTDLFQHRIGQHAAESVQIVPGQTLRTTFAVWEGGNLERAGIKAFATASAPVDSLFCGPWDQLLITLRGAGPMITINPYASFTTGGLAMRVLLTAILACCATLAPIFRRAPSFSAARPRRGISWPS